MGEFKAPEGSILVIDVIVGLRHGNRHQTLVNGSISGTIAHLLLFKSPRPPDYVI